MSKSQGNVITPDDYVDAHGSDVLRCSLLFSAPWERGGDFVDDAIAGIERFFARAWRTVIAPDTDTANDATVDRAIRDVSEAIENLTFNVAIARLMELAPNATSKRAKRALVRLLAPLAPHLAEELWHALGESYSVHQQPWPSYDATALATASVTLIVQVDGRLRGRVELPTGASETDAVAAARATIGEALDDLEIRRVVFVPDRIVNFVSS
jgi:leucyl-tRNA synthetase